MKDVLELRQFQKFTVDDIRRVVATNAKQRFALQEEPELMVRANQGHSFQVRSETTVCNHRTKWLQKHGSHLGYTRSFARLLLIVPITPFALGLITVQF